MNSRNILKREKYKKKMNVGRRIMLAPLTNETTASLFRMFFHIHQVAPTSLSLSNTFLNPLNP